MEAPVKDLMIRALNKNRWCRVVAREAGGYFVTIFITWGFTYYFILDRDRVTFCNKNGDK